MDTTEIRILIADDHPVFRAGLKQLIERAPHLHVVAEAEDGEAALRHIRELSPQVALLDLDMPLLNGFGVARRVQKENQAVALVFLTMHREQLYFDEAFDLGARGYLLKDGAPADIVTCLETVAAGKTYISPALTAFLEDRRARQVSPLPASGLQELTAAERRILRMMADCKTSRQIADDLGVSVRTVENTRARICQKLDLRGSHALVKFALQHKAGLD